MANWEMLENIENDLESKEKEITENKEKLEQVNEKISNIESALEKLTEDSKVKEIVSEKNREEKSEKEAAEKKRIELQKSVEEAENSLAILEEQNAHSQMQIEQLIEIGENMDEAVELIDARAVKIAAAQKKLEKLRSQLEYKLP